VLVVCGLYTWIGFILSIITLILVSRRGLAPALFTAGTVLGLFTLQPGELIESVFKTFVDPAILLLALVVGLISVIGGLLEDSGLMESLVRGLGLNRRVLTGLSPAMIGLLPIPGGALFSAPIVEKTTEEADNKLKASINVWFRHIIYLVYPLGPTLIVSAKMAGLSVYRVIPHLLPFFLVTILLGHIFFIRKIGDKTKKEGFHPEKVLPPLAVILLAPTIDYSFKKIFFLPFEEIATLIAILTSLALTLFLVGSKTSFLWRASLKMKPWKFFMIIIGMFVYLNIFKASGTPEQIAGLTISEEFLCIAISFLLGFSTGTIQVPISIVLPIYLTKFGGGQIEPNIFATTYFSVFLGYLVSPVHPCVVLTSEYFKTKVLDILKTMLPLITIALTTTLIAAILTT